MSKNKRCPEEKKADGLLNRILGGKKVYDRAFLNEDSLYKKLVMGVEMDLELSAKDLRSDVTADNIEAAGLLLVASDLKVKLSGDEKEEAARFSGLKSSIVLRVVGLSLLSDAMEDYVSEEIDRLEDKEERTEAQEERLETLSGVSSNFTSCVAEPLAEALDIAFEALEIPKEEPAEKRQRLEGHDDSGVESEEEEDDDFWGRFVEAIESCGDDF